MWSMGYIDDYEEGECEDFKIRHGNYIYVLDGPNSDTPETILETCYDWAVSPKTSATNQVSVEYGPGGLETYGMVVKFSHDGVDEIGDSKW